VDYKWEGPPSTIGSQIARGVMPPVAEYVARIVKTSIRRIRIEITQKSYKQVLILERNLINNRLLL
jgi:hypothetical protein